MVSLLEKIQKEKELLSTSTPKVSLQEGTLFILYLTNSCNLLLTLFVLYVHVFLQIYWGYQQTTYLLANRKKFLLLFLHLLLEMTKEDGTQTKQIVLSGGVDLQLMES